MNIDRNEEYDKWNFVEEQDDWLFIVFFHWCEEREFEDENRAYEYLYDRIFNF